MTTALLDLSKIGAHIRAHHKEFANTAPKGRAKRAVLENAARRHAQWHHLKKADHNHGGIPMTMQFGPIFSNHPEGYFTGEHLPVYDHLARTYAVFDRWHSSVPADTWPNRLYSLAGREADSIAHSLGFLDRLRNVAFFRQLRNLPIYEVEAVAEGLGWHLRVEVHRALDFSGELHVDDPDGIVVDAQFVPLDGCGPHLEACHPWVREPLAGWLAEQWTDARSYRYRLDGEQMGAVNVVRVS